MALASGRAALESLKAEAARLREDIERLEKQAKQLEKEIQQLKTKGAQAQTGAVAESLLSEKSEIGLVNIISSSVPGLDGHPSLRMLSDSIRKKEKLPVIFLSDQHGNCVVSCDEDAQKAGVRADALLKLAAGVAGGSGGGKADMAQGRLKEPGMFREVQECLRIYIRDQARRS